MDSKQGRRLMTLYSVDSFLDTHAERLPKAVSTGVRQRLGETIAELAQHVQTQHASPLIAQGLTRSKEEQREALMRDHMGPIARIARVVGAAVPELQPIKMPRGAPGVQKLLAHAEGMAVIAQQHRDVFIDAGLRPSFVEDFRAAIDDMQRTLAERANRYGDRAGAKEGLERGLVAGNKYKAVLDSFIRSEAHGNVELLTDWAIIKRVPLAPGRRRGKVEEVPAAPPTQPTAAPAVPQAESTAAPIGDPARLLSAPSTNGAAASFAHEAASLA